MAQTSAAASFRNLFVLAISFWILRVAFFLIIALLDPNMDDDEAEKSDWTEPGWLYHAFIFGDEVLAYVYWGFTALLLWNMRSHVRHQDGIPTAPYCPTGAAGAFCEDCCCSCWCPCLVVAQMMRHTANYHTQRAQCCTPTGFLSAEDDPPV